MQMQILHSAHRIHSAYKNSILGNQSRRKMLNESLKTKSKKYFLSRKWMIFVVVASLRLCAFAFTKIVCTQILHTLKNRRILYVMSFQHWETFIFYSFVCCSSNVKKNKTCRTQRKQSHRESLSLKQTKAHISWKQIKKKTKIIIIINRTRTHIKLLNMIWPYAPYKKANRNSPFSIRLLICAHRLWMSDEQWAYTKH